VVGNPFLLHVHTQIHTHIHTHTHTHTHTPPGQPLWLCDVKRHARVVRVTSKQQLLLARHWAQRGLNAV
jgi:hypothetical protein